MQRRVQKKNGQSIVNGTSPEDSKHATRSDLRPERPVSRLNFFSPQNLFFILLFVVYIVVPTIFSCSSFVRCHIIYLNWFNLSYKKNISEPATFGLNCTRNFFIDSEGGIKLGTWHILPQSRQTSCKDGTIEPSKEFEDERPVILYLHGNGGTRGGNHRLQLYKVLAYSAVDAHVIAIDYRGYGDSSSVNPTSVGITKDALAAYEWLITKVLPSRVLVWGHSLGTGVAVRLGAILSKGKDIPKGYILESPFNTIPDAVFRHPLTIFYRYLPSFYFQYFFTEPVKNDKNIEFNSEHSIGNINSPVLIMHAKDDEIVPYDLGHQLYLEGKKVKSDLMFISFESHLGYGHKHIWRDEKLPTFINEFYKR